MRMFHQHRRGHGWVARWMTRRLGRKLRLDAGQQARLETLQNRMHEVHNEIRELRRQTHAEVEKLISAEQLDREAAGKLLAVPRHAMEEHTPQMVDGFADFFDSLDGEQRSRLLGLWRRHQGHHGLHA